MSASPPSGQQEVPEEDRRLRYYVMLWLLAGIMIFVVSLRMYIRTFIRKAIGWDDYIMCLALATHLTEAVFLTLALRYGAMLHIYDIPIIPLLKVARWFTATEITAIIAPVLVKLSVCISILRIVTITQRRITRTVWVLMGVLVLTGFATFLVFCLQCIPLEKVWKPWLDGHCLDRTTILTNIYYFYGSVCTITDFFCGIIPVYVLYGLQMDRTTKIAVSCLLALVFLPGICSILKTIDVAETLNPDTTWAISGESTWVILEVSLGVILASLPMLYSSTVVVCQYVFSYLRTWNSSKKDESARSSQIPLKDALISAASTSARRSPDPSQQLRIEQDATADNELVVLRSENRIMSRKDALEYLAQRRREREQQDPEAGSVGSGNRTQLPAIAEVVPP